MPYTDQIADFTLRVRTCLELPSHISTMLQTRSSLLRDNFPEADSRRSILKRRERVIQRPEHFQSPEHQIQNLTHSAQQYEDKAFNSSFSLERPSALKSYSKTNYPTFLFPI